MKIQDLKQEHIDEYVANTSDFWHEFHKSLSAPFHFQHKFKDETLNDWIKIVGNSDELPSYLEHQLFSYPVLQGEYFIIHAKAMSLTNYRLFMNDKTTGLNNIPLSTIKEYDDNVIFEKNGHKVKIEWTSLKNEIVNAAIARAEYKELNEIQNLILESSFYELEKSNSLLIPKVSWASSQELLKNVSIQKSSGNSNVSGGSNIDISLAKDFISKFKPVLSIIKDTELTNEAQPNQLSKLEMSINNLLSGNYNKSYTLVNEVLEENTKIPAAWYIKAFIDAIDSSKSDDYLDNINLSLGFTHRA